MINLNLCKPNPCKNGGTCVPLSVSCDGNSAACNPSKNFICKCPLAFTGDKCETPVNPPVFKDKITCDFEHGFCHYKQRKNDDFDWTRKSEETPSGGTGPKFDHTTEREGYYVYIEASHVRYYYKGWFKTKKRKTNDTAIIESGFMESDGNKRCLDFYYHMWGSHMGFLDVFTFIRSSNYSLPYTLIFTKSGDQGQMWRQGLADIDIPSGASFSVSLVEVMQ